MSSPSGAARARRNSNGKPKAPSRAALARPRGASKSDLSQEAIELAREIERQFAHNESVLSVEAMQILMGTLCRVYSAQVESGAKFTPIPEGQVVSPTGVMLTASGMLRAANLAVFELGMWQSWTGR